MARSAQLLEALRGDASPAWIAALVIGGALLLLFVVLLGGPRDDRPRRR
ncbi:hypothetical protein O0235_04150 [Tepidiforma flava]|uniref:Uncharacterized protein n=1 Tax=Tepidiforma flava TaxID=3004094 RepID=A0ABY7M898_9CHLR|nr:hypothetical protein [Tepidiforma flava]WBL36759.1 hypothetical protein O0235_04150 [Tepidiforma flava]